MVMDIPPPSRRWSHRLRPHPGAPTSLRDGIPIWMGRLPRRSGVTVPGSCGPALQGMLQAAMPVRDRSCRNLTMMW